MPETTTVTEFSAPAATPVNIILTDLPPELATSVKALVLRHIGLLPPWVIELRVDWKPSLEDYIEAESLTNYAYRFLTINLGATWLKLDTAGRERALVHEMFHALLAPLNWALPEFRRLLGDAPRYQESINEALKERMEMVVCDLTHLYLSGRLTLLPSMNIIARGEGADGLSLS